MSANKYLRDKVDFGDSDWDRWILLRFSSFFEGEVRLERAEIELVESYRLALDMMYGAIKSDQLSCNPRIEEENSVVRPHAMVFKTYSLGIPFLFLARHLIELSIKRFLEANGSEVETGHKISELWAKCKKKAPVFSAYDDVIECLTIIDDDELHFRYVKDKNGKEYDNKPIFIDYARIYRRARQLSMNLVPTTTVAELRSK
jgi:HEPN domain-containing protein